MTCGKKFSVEFYNKNMINEMSLIEKAIRIAAVAHKGQTRKDGDIPYVVHPFMVAVKLLQHGFRDEVIAAALTHDVLEDTNFVEEKLREELGEEVVAIVKTVSEDKSLPWEERKEKYIETVKNGSVEAKAVSIADKISNTENLLAGYSIHGPTMWKYFSRGYKKMLWDRELALTMFKDTWKHPLIDEYEKVMASFRLLKE